MILLQRCLILIQRKTGKHIFYSALKFTLILWGVFICARLLHGEPFGKESTEGA